VLNEVINILIDLIDPFRHPEGSGFQWDSAATSDVGRYYVKITPDGGSPGPYQITGDPFAFRLRTPSNYPDNAVTLFRVQRYASRLQGYTPPYTQIPPPNFLELAMTFSGTLASQITWLAFEFHTKDEDLRTLYKSGTDLFPNLKSGDEFPCTAPAFGSGGGFTLKGIDQRLVCTYFAGSTSGSGTFTTPHRVFVTNFLLTTGVQGTIQFLINNPDGASGVSLRLGLKAYGQDAANTIFSSTNFYGWGDIENGFDLGGYEQVQAQTGYVTPATITSASQFLHPVGITGANTAYTVNVDFSPSYGAGTTSDIAIIKIPIRVQARTYSSWAPPGPNNAYDDVCKSMLTESVTFYYKPSGTHEVYAYVYKDFTGGVTAQIALTSLSCQYYRVTGVGASTYLWNAYYYSSDKLTMNQLAL